MGIEDVAINRRNEAYIKGKSVLPESYNGVTKQKITEVLTKIDRCSANMVEAVFALLCDEPSWMAKWAKAGYMFKDGATTAQIGTHVGILQRGNNIKLDREGRDYWLKPLWEIGAIQKVYYDSKKNKFLSGHPIAKSPNSAYKLQDEFIRILESPDETWQQLASKWISSNVLRERLALQAEQADSTSKYIQSSHSRLIQASYEVYAKRFLPNYQVLYIDDGDGDRVTDAQKEKLLAAGITITLHDAMPDVLLWNSKNDSLWIIEAVTSDGEVDLHKYNQLNAFARRNGKADIGFTTTYPTWRKAAERQSQLKNLVNGSYIWIQEDPSRHLLIQQNAVQDG